MHGLSRQAQAGFTLVEVMVTVFVVAIGLLSAAALQVVSKKAAFDALQRSTATVIAQDMLERIRANKAQVTLYASSGAKLTTTPPTPSCGKSNACDAVALVDYDLSQWWAALDGADEQIAEVGGSAKSAGGLQLPMGCIRNNGAVVEVVVAWRGLTEIEQATDTAGDDPTADECGRTDTDRYDYKAGTNRSYRRVLRLRAYV